MDLKSTPNSTSVNQLRQNWSQRTLELQLPGDSPQCDCRSAGHWVNDTLKPFRSRGKKNPLEKPTETSSSMTWLLQLSAIQWIIMEIGKHDTNVTVTFKNGRLEIQCCFLQSVSHASVPGRCFIIKFEWNTLKIKSKPIHYIPNRTAQVSALVLKPGR